MAISINTYQLENDSLVEVHKVFGNRYYLAIVTIDGRYPEDNKVAHDIKRSEYIYIIEGEILVSLNGIEYTMKQGESRLIKDGDYYWIKGKGKVLVFVHDKQGGVSNIE